MWAHFVGCMFDQTLFAHLAAPCYVRQTRCWSKMFDHLAGAINLLRQFSMYICIFIIPVNNSSVSLSFASVLTEGMGQTVFPPASDKI